VEVELVHKKINVSDPNIGWEHEVFSRKRIPAATISHFATPAAQLFSRSNVLDTTYISRQEPVASFLMVGSIFVAAHKLTSMH